MIDIPQPAIALNDQRTNTWYSMQESRTIFGGTKRSELIDMVLQFCHSGSKGTSLFDLSGELVQHGKAVVGKVHVVINCHGSPGNLSLGEGIRREHLAEFGKWSGFVEKIWINACRPAFIKMKGSPTDGNMFCSELAKQAKCYVVASTERQTGKNLYPFGKIDSFEGLVLSYGPTGDLTWSHRYPSHWRSNRE
ncbi:MAG: hypothetical protein ABI878_16250 [Acidobacteriota bacterium]